MYQINTNKGTEFIIPDYNQFDLGLFLLIRKSLKKLDLNAGARYDFRFFSNDQMFIRTDPSSGFVMQVSLPDTSGSRKVFSEYKHTFSGLSASAGITYNLSKNFGIKMNLARGFRAPNISEIMEYYARQDRVYLAGNTETPTSGYTSFDAGIGGVVLKKSGKVLCSLHLAISNIFDIAYQSHLSRLKYFEPYPGNASGKSGIYDMGRNISFKVIFPISN